MGGVNKALHVKADLSKAVRPEVPMPWTPFWPNPADVTYNYYNLLSTTRQTGIANVLPYPSMTGKRIAIIGAGYGGMTVARELFRSGFGNITIFEATDRIGGRGYTVMPERWDGKDPNSVTPYEYGAMRIPFFTPETGWAADFGNSVMKYFVDDYLVQNQPFPDPGTQNMLTGIYMNEGYGPVVDRNKFVGMLNWFPTSQNPKPPTAALQSVYDAWGKWSQSVLNAVAPIYATPQWPAFWQKIATACEYRNFRDVALMQPKDGSQDGDFGGLGLTVAQAELFYTIGAGDGSWGAFFDIGALYPIRTLLFGYATQHHLLGHVNAQKQPFAPGTPVTDISGKPFQSPLFAGVGGIPEMHFFAPVTSAISSVNGQSLYQRMIQNRNLGPGYGIKLFTQMPVAQIDSPDPTGGPYTVTTATGLQQQFDIIVFTAPGWSTQMNIDLTQNFKKRVFVEAQPADSWSAMTTWHGMKMSHNITSAKVFFRLKQRYWENGLPQVIATDTILQDVYGYAVDKDSNGNPVNDPGVLLCSYTWEDDSNKFLASHTSLDDQVLAQKCLDKLDEVLALSGLPKMSQFVDPDFKPSVWHWERQPFYRSCAKLYRAGSWDWNYAQLSWNQEKAASRGVYLAGEFAGLEGGWIEPAYRGALDAVVHLIRDLAAGGPGDSVFNNPQMVQNYPTIEYWSPQP